ncbi:dyslexia-associated protein KIAA0319-like protein [Glandiceps talaboti]
MESTQTHVKHDLEFCDSHSSCADNEYCWILIRNHGICKCVEGYQRNSVTNACQLIDTEPPSLTESPEEDDNGEHTDNTAASQSTKNHNKEKDKDDKASTEDITKDSRNKSPPIHTTTSPTPTGDSNTRALVTAETKVKSPTSVPPEDLVIPNPSKKNKEINDESDDGSQTVTESVLPVSENKTSNAVNETDREYIPTQEVSKAPHVTSKPITEPMVTLTVSAGDDKELHLPDEDSVSLFAYVLPQPDDKTKYQYEWNLISGPDDNAGIIAGKHQFKCNLSKLTAGLYQFKVTVTGDHAYGEDFVNVTVLPKPRVNTAPVAVITPDKQEVTLPNSETVLDGSRSTDDDKIVSYHWEEIKGPLREEKVVGDEALLTMKNLIPGTYTVQLTVTDSDGATNSTTAEITVHEEVDYAPVANAGINQVIKLPKNSVTLNGSMSSDDKGIDSYEWSKDSGSPADMQGTSKPILRLSNLEEGVYVFTLKVTDTSGQENSAKVTVIVQPENNSPPEANAGPDKEISLPSDETELDGSKSTDDQRITSYKWEKQSGPGNAKIKDDDKVKATVSNLQQGTYIFQLTVTDAEGSTSTSTVSVVVKQEKNEPPKANAGEDFTVAQPMNYVEVDGSKSTDDTGIVSFEWICSGKSPAAGEIVGTSNHEAVLKLTNLVVGIYTFTLKVTDAKNLHDSDSVTVEIQPDPNLYNLVEVHVNADLRTFTQDNKDTLIRQLSVLLGVMDADIKVQSVRESRLDGVLVEFYVLNPDATKVLKGIAMVNKLKQKLRKESQVLDLDVILVDTVVCQNDCSGHGSCNVETKHCVCESFWMENFFKVYIGDGETNCEWSILYVVIISSLVVVLLGIIVWGIVCLIKRQKMKIRKRHRYAILNDFDDDGEAMEMLPKSKNGKNNSSIMISETDSDEDTLYDSKNTKKNNGYKPSRPRPVNGLIPSRKHNKRKDTRLKPLLQQNRNSNEEL